MYGDVALDPLASNRSVSDPNQLSSTALYVIAIVFATSSGTCGVKATSTTTRASTPVGARLGVSDGATDGTAVGAIDGAFDGIEIGPYVDGALLGLRVSPSPVGESVDGATDGATDGNAVGPPVITRQVRTMCETVAQTECTLQLCPGSAACIASLIAVSIPIIGVAKN